MVVGVGTGVTDSLDNEAGTECMPFVAVVIDIHAVVFLTDVTDSSWKLPARANIPRSSIRHTIRCMIDFVSSPAVQSK